MNTPIQPTAFSFYLGLTDQNGESILDHNNIDAVRRIIARQFSIEQVEAFTILQGHGVWEGVEEETLVIFVDEISVPVAKELAETLAMEFNQECVGVRPENTMELVNNPLN